MLGRVNMIVLSFGIGVGVFANHNSLFKEFDLPEEEKNAKIDYCPPTGFKQITLPDGTKRRKYMYPSEFAGITESDDPPYDLIESRDSLGEDLLSKKARVFLGLMAEGVGPEYGCDKVSVLYFAKFIRRYWPGAELREKYPNSAELVDGFLDSRYSIPLVRHARIEARNMISAENQ